MISICPALWYWKHQKCWVILCHFVSIDGWQRSYEY